MFIIRPVHNAKIPLKDVFISHPNRGTLPACKMLAHLCTARGQRTPFVTMNPTIKASYKVLQVKLVINSINTGHMSRIESSATWPITRSFNRICVICGMTSRMTALLSDLSSVLVSPSS